jgi:hypothetical protein
VADLLEGLWHGQEDERALSCFENVPCGPALFGRTAVRFREGALVACAHAGQTIAINRTLGKEPYEGKVWPLFQNRIYLIKVAGGMRLPGCIAGRLVCAKQS